MYTGLTEVVFHRNHQIETSNGPYADRPSELHRASTSASLIRSPASPRLSVVTPVMVDRKASPETPVQQKWRSFERPRLISTRLEPVPLLAGVHPLVHLRYTFPPCLPDPDRLAVPTRPVVVRAAPTFPCVPRFFSPHPANAASWRTLSSWRVAKAAHCQIVQNGLRPNHTVTPGQHGYPPPFGPGNRGHAARFCELSQRSNRNPTHD
jgi:hypothetical protein